MTNTPMTSREAFEALVNKFDRGLRLDLTPHHDTQFGTYLRVQTECAYRIYQASQAQQAQRIKKLEDEIAHLGEISNICTYNALRKVCSDCKCSRAISKGE